MAADVIAVIDALGIARAAFIGWSDGACVAMEVARAVPGRVSGVFFFACNMDPSGVKAIEESNPLLGRCFGRHAADYKALAPQRGQEGRGETDGGDFESFVAAVTAMQRTQPDWSAAVLATIGVPVAVVLGEHDEFIKREHAEYLARTIPGATLTILPGVSHFAPLQRPELFNAAVLEFLRRG
jgi:non-heme chloroperoxidase